MIKITIDPDNFTATQNKRIKEITREHMERFGASDRSSSGKSLSYAVEWCEENKDPYIIQAYPGVGYRLETVAMFNARGGKGYEHDINDNPIKTDEAHFVVETGMWRGNDAWSWEDESGNSEAKLSLEDAITLRNDLLKKYPDRKARIVKITRRVIVSN